MLVIQRMQHFQINQVKENKMAHLYDLNPHLKPKAKEKPKPKKKDVKKDEQANDAKSKN